MARVRVYDPVSGGAYNTGAAKYCIYAKRNPVNFIDVAVHPELVSFQALSW